MNKTNTRYNEKHGGEKKHVTNDTFQCEISHGTSSAAQKRVCCKLNHYF